MYYEIQQHFNGTNIKKTVTETPDGTYDVVVIRTSRFVHDVDEYSFKTLSDVLKKVPELTTWIAND